MLSAQGGVSHVGGVGLVSIPICDLQKMKQLLVVGFTDK